MNFSRLCQTIRLWTIPGAVKRAEYLKKKKVFASFGEKCSYMDRKVPLYAKLIKVGINVHFASHVTFLTHDVVHMMINRMNEEEKIAKEKVGCIEIGNHVFVGANTTILYDVKIGNNVIIGAGSLVNKDVPNNSVVGGIPARVIGDYDSFIKKRIIETGNSDDSLSPNNEDINCELERHYWNLFYKKRL